MVRYWHQWQPWHLTVEQGIAAVSAGVVGAVDGDLPWRHSRQLLQIIVYEDAEEDHGPYHHHWEFQSDNAIENKHIKVYELQKLRLVECVVRNLGRVELHHWELSQCRHLHQAVEQKWEQKWPTEQLVDSQWLSRQGLVAEESAVD